MSQENAELVRRAIDAFDLGELGAPLDFLDPEIVWITGIFVEPNMYEGHEGVRRYLGALAGDFEELRVSPEELSPEELIDAGNHLVVPARLTGRGRLSGAPVELNFTLLY